MTVNGPVGPMTTTAYIPLTLITTDPNPVVLGSLEQITITASVNGPKWNKIPGTTIYGMVIPPSPITAKTEHTFSGLTDSTFKS